MVMLDEYLSLIFAFRLLSFTTPKSDEQQPQQAVGQVGAPKCKQVESLVAVDNACGYALIEVGFHIRVHEHINCKNI